MEKFYSKHVYGRQSVLNLKYTFDGTVVEVAERFAAAMRAVFDSRTKQIFIWPTGICYGSECLCM